MVENNTLENSEYPLYGRTFGIWIGSPGLIENLRIRGNVIKGYPYGLSDIAPHPVKPRMEFADNIFDKVDCMRRGMYHLTFAGNYEQCDGAESHRGLFGYH